jgi:long-chain fatty acid transport protein
MKIVIRMTIAGLVAGAGVWAHATNGYFTHAYGMKSKGSGGASAALAQDAFAGANNPASVIRVGTRLDIGLDLFSPIRSASRVGGAPGINGEADSDSNYFFIPEVAYSHGLGDSRFALGISIYGNGGMQTNYAGDTINCGGGPANLLCGSGRLGVDLSQLFIAPTLGVDLGHGQSLGIAPVFSFQRFKVEGIDSFGGLSQDPDHLTNKGDDDSSGVGLKVGWQGKFGERWGVGATYQPRIQMRDFNKYKGLFAENGGFDIPANWEVGASAEVSDSVTVALDYGRVYYNSVKSIGNPSRNALNGAQLGEKDGPGFGWQDVSYWQLGVLWDLSEKMTLRAGYDHSDNPIQSEDVTFNILAPGVIQDHVTLGGTFAVSERSEVSLSYMHAFHNSVTGNSLFTDLGMAPAGTKETIQMRENSFGIAYGLKFK